MTSSPACYFGKHCKPFEDHSNDDHSFKGRNQNDSRTMPKIIYPWSRFERRERGFISLCRPYDLFLFPWYVAIYLPFFTDLWQRFSVPYLIQQKLPYKTSANSFTNQPSKCLSNSPYRVLTTHFNSQTSGEPQQNTDHCI